MTRRGVVADTRILSYTRFMGNFATSRVLSCVKSRELNKNPALFLLLFVDLLTSAAHLLITSLIFPVHKMSVDGLNLHENEALWWACACLPCR